MTIVNGNIVSAVPLPPPALSNITPFTYRDGLTYLEVLTAMRSYIVEVLVPEIENGSQDLIDQVNAVLAAVEQALADQTTWVQEQIDTLTQYVNDAVDSIINDSIQVQDPVMAGIMGNKTSQTRIVTDGLYNAKFSFDMLMEGAAADGVTDDWPVFVATRTKAGAKGTIHFSAKPGAAETVYYFAGSRPSLIGVNITAGPDVVIKFADENPNTKDLVLRSAITLENVIQNQRVRKPVNTDLNHLAAFAIAGGSHYEPLQFSAMSFTDSTWQVGEFATGLWGASGTWTGLVEGAKLSWTTPFVPNAQGGHHSAEIGNSYDITFETIEQVNTAGYVGVVVGSNVIGLLSAEWRFNVNTTVAQRYVQGVLDATFTLPSNNGKGFQLPLSPAPGLPGAMIARISVVSASVVEIYVNGYLVDRFTTPFTIARFGAIASGAASAGASIERIISYSASHNIKHANVNILVVGDSQSYGAWSSIAIEDLLPVAVASVIGGGYADVTNLSVSGTSAQAWVDNGKLVDPVTKVPINVSSYNYVIVNLGTNNVQGGGGQFPLASAIIDITNDVRSQGSEPIYGVFPSYVGQSIGTGGAATLRADEIAAYRTIIQFHCAGSNVQFADINEQFTNGIKLFLDRIHPNSLGQALMARAYAQAIGRKHAGGNDRAIATLNGVWTNIPSGWFANSWVSGPSAAAQYRKNANGDVELRGRINGGNQGAIAINFPPELRPIMAGGYGGRALNAGVEVAGTLAIGTTGGLSVNIGSSGTGSTTFTSIDTCKWSTV